MARLKEDGETLVVKCGFDERDLRMQFQPDMFFTTDHYRGYPSVLVRLTKVRLKDLREVIEVAWRLAAPKKPLEQGRGSRLDARGKRSRSSQRVGGRKPDA